MTDLLLGIDIGTSSCKVAVFDLDGHVIHQTAENYPVFYPHPGWAEQDPNQWWEAVATCIQRITAKIPKESIRGIGIDGQSWSAIAIDAQQNVLCNTPIWMDTRASDICQRVTATHGENPFFSISGNPFAPSYTLPKILWYKENEPEIYQNIYKVLQSNSFIAMKLTGVISQDYSQGYGLQCYDVANRCWDFSVLESLGLRTDILPDFYECHQVVGSVTSEAAAFTGLLEGTPVVAGGLDAACGTLGAGVLHQGETQEQGGQAGGMSICTDTPISHPALILSNHVVPDRWLLQGGTVGGGGVLNWFERNFGDYERTTCGDRSSFELLSDMAEAIPPTSDGLLFLPYMSGERSPLWNPDAKGVYFGIDFAKTKGHFVRAAMEGVGYSLEHNLRTACDVGAQVDTLYAVGGSANSRVWTQLKADITGKEIRVPYSDAATTLGAVILAGVGVGLYKDFSEAVSRTVTTTRIHTPDPARFPIYQKAFDRYCALYESTKHLMKEE